MAADAQNGELVEIDRVTGQTHVVANVFAGQLLALVRQGVSCPEATQILGIDNTNSRVFLLTIDGELIDWVAAPFATSLATLAGGNPFDLTDSVLIGRALEVGGDIQSVQTPGIYQPDATNPPPLPPVVTDLLQFQFSANVINADPFFGVPPGTVLNGRFHYSPQSASLIAVLNPFQTLYSLGLLGNIELDVNGVTYNSNVNGDDEATLVVVNDLPSPTVIDLLLLRQGAAGLQFQDTNGAMFDSTMVPTVLPLDALAPGITINVEFVSVDGIPHSIFAHIFGIQVAN